MPEDGRFDHEPVFRTGLPGAVHQALERVRLSLRGSPRGSGPALEDWVASDCAPLPCSGAARGDSAVFREGPQVPGGDQTLRQLGPLADLGGVKRRRRRPGGHAWSQQR